MILSKLRIWLYECLVNFYPWMYRNIYGMEIGKGTNISRKSRIDRGINPKGIHIGANTRITGGVVMLAHDDCRQIKCDTYIGDNCFIGVNSIIMPGVHIGNQVIIGSGSVVTKDIPDNCIAAGNPAKIIRTGVILGPMGRIINRLD